MSEGFHVHGAHDHAVEHQAQSGDSLAGQIAIFTAILASVGAIVSYQGGDTQNQAMLFKNEAEKSPCFRPVEFLSGQKQQGASDGACSRNCTGEQARVLQESD
jgi:hypothetical protein